MPLNAKRRKFVDEYLKDGNGTQAAIRAGYSPHTAKDQAARLLSFASIREAVDKRQRRIEEKTDVTVSDVIRVFVNEMANGDCSAARISAAEKAGKYLGMFVDRLRIEDARTKAVEYAQAMGIPPDEFAEEVERLRKRPD